ncbi:hypothetical protein WMO40_12800 [Bacillaceae bacterium CLA-AA-H227]|uniref:Uncharacterized protein n=2 Tax=Robertmurraya TaxID=2837507 RepID=A0A4U1CZD3_9BACI|nr:hypothetical protein [Robertmurraya kyonggiensis]TKC15124.1 hypothetical protein FA727_19750 [Robertmurraya kyonggiensis]
MDYYQRHEIKKISSENDEYTIFIYPAEHLSEFTDELGTIPREKKDVVTLAKKIIKERYPNVKVTMVKVIIGGIAVTSIPLMGANSPSVHAEEPITSNSQFHNQTPSTIRYL